jgi:NAD(P)H-dependent flavin oxidoreductase YrpB (nitropropane dioxygenase family)
LLYSTSWVKLISKIFARWSMSLKPLKIRNKVLEVPIIQGGMGVGLSWEKLAGAVAREGAMGVISAVGHRL